MTSAAVSSVTAYSSSPQLNETSAVIKYTKANAGDTYDVSNKMAISAIDFAVAVVDAAGAADPLTWSGTTITFTTGTGAGRVFVVGH